MRLLYTHREREQFMWRLSGSTRYDLCGWLSDKNVCLRTHTDTHTHRMFFLFTSIFSLPCQSLLNTFLSIWNLFILSTLVFMYIKKFCFYFHSLSTINERTMTMTSNIYELLRCVLLSLLVCLTLFLLFFRLFILIVWVCVCVTGVDTV